MSTDDFDPPPKLDPRYRPVGQEDARHRISSTLKQAQLELRTRGFDSSVLVHTNRDGSIDAELFVKETRGKEPLDVFMNTRESLPTQMPGVWISTGARFEARRDFDNYYRHKSGLTQAQSYYQKYTPSKSPSNMFVGQRVAEKIEKRQRKKIDGIFVRLHWNAEDSKPGRSEEKRKDRRKRKAKSKRK